MKIDEKWIIKIISWSFCIYFLTLSIKSNAIIQERLIQEKHIYLFASILLGLFPFIHEIRIGSLLEIKRAINESKEETQTLKKELVSIFGIISSNMNSISMGNLSNTVNVSLSAEEHEKLNILSKASKEDTNEIKEELLLEDEDKIMALARTRIRIEYLLRSIANKIIEDNEHIKKIWNKDTISKWPLSRLFELFLSRFPNYKDISNSFRFVVQVCNAAMHAQWVSSQVAEDALNTGARIIGILMNIDDDISNK